MEAYTRTNTLKVVASSMDRNQFNRLMFLKWFPDISCMPTETEIEFAKDWHTKTNTMRVYRLDYMRINDIRRFDKINHRKKKRIL